MAATIILRKDKTSPLTWEEMDNNLVALRDTPGPQGIQGIQGIPGSAGPAADASVSAMLSIDSIVLNSDIDGVVPPSSYEVAVTNMLIILGIMDDTANWTFTKEDSDGVTSTIVDSKVTLTHIDDATDVGTITITANRPGGYPTLVRAFGITKAKSGDAGPPGTSGPAADASVSAVLTSEAYILPASITGVVANVDYAAATTAMQIILGIVDDSANWVFTKVDSAGVTSTITGNVVSVTNVTDSIDTGSVTISAKRTGYPTLKRVFDISKAKAGPIGPDGEPGKIGPVGPTGTSGVPGIRGSRQFYVAVTTSTWSDALASSTAAVSAGPVLNDTVIQYNSATGFVQTRFWTGTSWAIVNVVINGNLLVDGTVGAQKMVANTITANSGIIAQAAIGTLLLAGNSVTQAIHVAQTGVTDGNTGYGYQLNVVPTPLDTFSAPSGWTTIASRSGITITGTQPVMVWGSAQTVGLHAYGTGSPPDYAGDSAQPKEMYAGINWVYNKRSTWYRAQIMCTHSDGTKYYAKLANGIQEVGSTKSSALTAVFSTMKAGTYTFEVQFKADINPAWVNTPIECFAVRMVTVIILETKR